MPLPWDESKPNGAVQPIRDLDNEIRALRQDVRTLMAVEHEATIAGVTLADPFGAHKLGSARLLVNTEANILATTPKAGMAAFATDSMRVFFALDPDGADPLGWYEVKKSKTDHTYEARLVVDNRVNANAGLYGYDSTNALRRISRVDPVNDDAELGSPDLELTLFAKTGTIPQLNINGTEHPIFSGHDVGEDSGIDADLVRGKAAVFTGSANHQRITDEFAILWGTATLSSANPSEVSVLYASMALPFSVLQTLDASAIWDLSGGAAQAGSNSVLNVGTFAATGFLIQTGGNASGGGRTMAARWRALVETSG